MNLWLAAALPSICDLFALGSYLHIFTTALNGVQR